MGQLHLGSGGQVSCEPDAACVGQDSIESGTAGGPHKIEHLTDSQDPGQSRVSQGIMHQLPAAGPQ